MLWTRTIGSTVVGQGVDSLIFYPLAFFGARETGARHPGAAHQLCLKVPWEVILTPVTYAWSASFKRREGVDVFDRDTDFTPFKTRSEQVSRDRRHLAGMGGQVGDRIRARQILHAWTASSVQMFICGAMMVGVVERADDRSSNIEVRAAQPRGS